MSEKLWNELVQSAETGECTNLEDVEAIRWAANKIRALEALCGTTTAAFRGIDRSLSSTVEFISGLVEDTLGEVSAALSVQTQGKNIPTSGANMYKHKNVPWSVPIAYALVFKDKTLKEVGEEYGISPTTAADAVHRVNERATAFERRPFRENLRRPMLSDVRLYKNEWAKFVTPYLMHHFGKSFFEMAVSDGHPHD